MNRRRALTSGQITVLEDRTLLAAPVMLKDINPYSEAISSYATNFVEVGDKLYFVSQSANRYGNSNGSILMVTDGTTTGTSVVAEFGYYGGSVYILAETGGTLFLLAEGGDNLGLELWKSDGTAAGTTIIKDIRPGWRSSNLGPVAVLNGSIVFWADDGTHGRELWKSDGTSAGTVMVKEFMPGSGGGAPDPSLTGQGRPDLYAYNGRVYFLARTPVYGEELWSTDGSEAGTTIVRDIRPGADGASIRSLQFFDNGAYFWADDGVTGSELWKTDGTVGGTVFVKDINPGANGSSQAAFTHFNGAVYFAANDGASGTELWKTNGTVGGTVRLTNLANASAPISAVQEFDGSLFLNMDGSIWRTDGNVSGTTLVKSGVSIHSPHRVGGTLYFDSGGLWKTDGTEAGTQRITSQYFNTLAEAGGTLYFRSSDPTHGHELWKSDGTTAGTVMLGDLWPGVKSSYGVPVYSYRGRLLFSANDGARGTELWTTDGTVAGTVILKEVFGSRGYDSFVEHSPFHENTGALYFLAWEGTGAGLWKTDGTATGTTRVFSSPASDPFSSIRDLTEVNGVWYFTAETANHGSEVWKYDGTSAEPTLLKNVASGSRSALPYNLVSGNGVLYFHADSTPSSGTEQWRSDGTTAGTLPVRTETNQILPAVTLTVVNGTAYFSYNRTAEGSELWTIDETTGRAVLFADLLPGPTGSFPNELTDIDGVLYFATVDTVFGKRLWKSDGTPGGTVVVKDFGQSLSAGPSRITAVGDDVFFQIVDGQGGVELWKTDGTGAGTSRVRQFPFTQPIPADPYAAFYLNLESLTDVQGTLYFTAVDNEHGRELWTSDGTESGTRLVKNITPEPWEISYRKEVLVAVGNHLYFTADDGLHGTELWRTDGTAEGTWRFEEIQPGSRGDFIVDLRLLGETLLIAASTYDHGIEPWAMAVNHPPTGLSLNTTTVPENVPAGTVVGILQSIDSDPGESFTYSFVAGPGDSGNSAFEIVGNQLRVKSPLNYEAQSSYFIRVRTSDFVNEWHEQVLSITVADVLELPVGAPGDVDPSPNQILENSPGGSIVGVTIDAIDPDSGPGAVTYSLVDDAGGRFWVHPTLGSVFVASGAVLDYEAATSHSITVRAASIDGTSSLTTVLINVLDSPGDNQPGPRAPTLVKDFATDNPGQIESTGWTFQAGPMLFFVTSLHSLMNYPDLQGSNLFVTYGETGGTFLLKEFSTGDIDFLGAINGTVLFSVKGDARNGKELWKTDGTPQGTIQIRDINPGREGSYPYAPSKFQGVLYFRADDGIHGTELWRSDGTQAGTFLVKDINPGPADSRPDDYWEVNGRLAFFASHTAYGREVWTTDGTEAGTTLLAETRPGTQSSNTDITKLPDGRFLFKKFESALGEELWISDGTVGGTSLLKDIRLGAGSSFVGGIEVVGNRFYFTAADDTHGSELWISDGTTLGTNLVKDIRPGSVDSSTGNFFAVGSTLYFTASSGASGSEWWRTDGTEVGTVRLADVIPTMASMSASSTQVVGSTLYFGTNNGQFWKTDGTAAGTQKLADNIVFNGGQLLAGVLYFFNSTGLYRTDGTPSGTSQIATVNSDYPTLFTESAIYFFNTDPTHGRELWKSDGTAAGTLMVKDVKPGPKSSYIESVRYFNGKLYFSADSVAESPTERINRHWWVSDGTEAGTVQFNDSFGTRNRSSDPYYFTEMDGLLYFVNWTPTGVKIWKSDGTDAGTTALPTPVFTGIRELTAVNGKLYFQGAVPATDFSGQENEELWVTDGTLAGTVRVKDIRPGTAGSFPRSLTSHGGLLYFNANDFTGGYQLWQSDGTAAGTVKVPTSQGGSVELISFPQSVNGTLYFMGDTDATGSELWKIDPITGIAVLVKDIYPGVTDSRPMGLTSFQGATYFLAADADHGFEIWRTDGTEAGTVRVTDIYPSVPWSFPDTLEVVGNTLFFQVHDQNGRVELWKTDGTPVGETLVRAFTSPNYRFDEYYYESHLLQDVIGLNDTLYFTAFDDEHGRELWKSDGTAAGTVMIKDIWPGPYANRPSQMLPVGDRLFFLANDGVHGQELWQSDGTAAGTLMHGEISPGPRFGAIWMPKVIGNKLFLVAETFTEGVELWSLTLNSSPTSLSLDAASVTENTAAGQVVGRFTTSDPDAGESFVYELVPGAADSGNFLFSIVGNELRVADTPNRETQGSFSIRVRSSDSERRWVESIFTITLVDVDEFDVSLPIDTNPAANTIPENSPVGTPIGITAFASDADATNNTVTYSLTNDAGGRFGINISTGVVFLANGLLLDRETTASHSIIVRALSSDGSSKTQSFVINVADVDEFDVTTPVDNAAAVNAVAENASNGAAVGITAFASDADATNNAVIYSLTDNAGGRFAINANSGVVTVANGSLLDFESATLHSITVQATSSDGSTSTHSFSIAVTDVDEFNVSPVVDSNSAPNVVAENVANGHIVTSLAPVASDADGTNNAITWSLTDDAGGRFAIDPAAGFVTVLDAALLNYEAATSHVIAVRATSEDSSFSEQSFVIQVTDIDEFNVNPITDTNASANMIPEHSPNGTPVGITAFAQDLDGSNNQITYSLWNTRAGRFAIDPVTGVVTVDNGAILDREVQGTWTITVLATSQDGSISVKEFTVDLADVNEFKVGKVFDLNSAPDTVVENAANGTPVGITGFGIDLDATNSAVSYSLWNTRGGRFAINPTTGVVTVANGSLLDREAQGTWTITVLATSQDGSISVKDFAITLQDVDEHNVGQVFDLDSAANSVPENAANGTTVGITGFGIDLDSTNSAITYSLTDNAGGRFAIHPTSGVVTVANGALLDRETAAAWGITIKATSQDSSFSTRAFSIALTDVDELDVGPVGDVNPAANAVSENSSAGTLVGLTANAVDGDVTNNTVTYSLSNTAGGRFQIHPTTGIMSVAAGAVLDFEAQTSHQITVLATGSDGSTSQASFTIQLTDVPDTPRVTLSNNTVAENRPSGTLVGNLGTADISVTSPVYTLVSGTGATDNSQFSITGNQLKTRSSFNFESKSSYSIRVRMTGAGGVTLAQVLTILVTNVNEGPTGLSLSGALPENNAIGAMAGTLLGVDPDTGDPLTYTLISGSGSSDNFRFTIVGNQLKAAEVFDYERKRTFSIRVRVTDAAGLSYEKVITVRVTNGPG